MPSRGMDAIKPQPQTQPRWADRNVFKQLLAFEKLRVAVTSVNLAVDSPCCHHASRRKGLQSAEQGQGRSLTHLSLESLDLQFGPCFSCYQATCYPFIESLLRIGWNWMEIGGSLALSNSKSWQVYNLNNFESLESPTSKGHFVYCNRVDWVGSPDWTAIAELKEPHNVSWLSRLWPLCYFELMRSVKS